MKISKLPGAREMITQNANVQIDERDKCHRMGVQIMISKCEGLHAVLSFWYRTLNQAYVF